MADIEKQKVKVMKVHLDLVKIVDKYLDDFEAKNNLRLSYPNATKKIAEKINLAGGLKVK